MNILNSYKEHEKDGFYFYNLASEYLRKHDKKMALSLLQKAVKITPLKSGYGPMLAKKLIITLIELMQYKDALQQIKFYLEIYVDFIDLYFLEANSHIACGRYSKASKSLDKYIYKQSIGSNYPTQTFVKPKELPRLINDVKKKVIACNNIKLSVCIIVKDDYNLLIKCITSVNEIAHEIIVVDTGSKDNSEVLANQYGASVYPYEWSNNFSNVRNYAMKKATGDWILFIDADEILPQQSKCQLVRLLVEAEADAYYLNVITFLDQNITYLNCISQNSCRLIKNNKYQYNGCIYESVIESIINSGGVIKYAQIKILHLHYLRSIEQLYEKKHIKWNIIELQYKEQLALQYYSKARESFFSMDFVATSNFCEQYLLLSDLTSELCFFYTIVLYHNTQYSKAIEISEKYMQQYSDYTDLKYIQALCQYKLSHYNEAENLLEKCINYGESPWEKYTLSVGSGSFKAMQSLVALYKRQDKHEKANELLVQLAKIDCTKSKALTEIMNYYIDKDMLSDMLCDFVNNELYNVDNLMILLKQLISDEKLRLATNIVKDVNERMQNNREFIKQFCISCNSMLKKISNMDSQPPHD